ncbi:prephenate dehydrogenase Tyr1 [Schizosaccharomyces osmophilus]|uniref:Prephenate dehydrogenase [NADP(+)] n=1 Tax=Schizosaccharomyces osmophilus TaxID=2545709 RepID=A0AAE9WEQ8_9SCHI|nr:prephenate dehydrogenase Tyr1 [Schizosaccharomyces osmophilus]WBW74924.1 prephenate dehydrogenase Tyr1 [Schizosaccharomyces osmophilus]
MEVPVEELKKEFQIGIIGFGDMGRLYAERFSQAGWIVNVCDRKENFETVKERCEGTNINALQDGFEVSRKSDYILYSVESEYLDRIVGMYGPATKVGSIVGGQSSCKSPEIRAFEKYLPKDVEIISCHSMHGPRVNPQSQPLVIIRHRAKDRSFEIVKEILSCLQSSVVFLTAEEHDRITADTQAVTHAAFLAMGMAWRANNQYPWDINRWCGGIENIKMNLSMRIYSSKWHVYAGLAILNPDARKQIKQYATSVTELFKLAISGKAQEFENRVRNAGKFVFGEENNGASSGLLLSDELLDQYSISNVPNDKSVGNSHLSILAIVDSWWKLGIHPQKHMICSTPLFRLWVGVSEYVFCNPDLLTSCIYTATKHNEFCPDDLEFVLSARSWSEHVEQGDFENYKKQFVKIQDYFRPRFEEATKVGNAMIKKLLENLKRTA